MTADTTSNASPAPEESTEAPAISVRYEARTPALRRYISFYAVAFFGISLLWGTVVTIILPLHVQDLTFARVFTGADATVNLQTLTDLKAQVAAHKVDPTAEQQRLLGLLSEFNAAKAGSLSLVTSLSLVLMMLGGPIIGMLSDRTRSPWGRRAPWIAAGGVAGAALVALMPVVPSIAVLVIVWSAAQLMTGFAQGPLQTTVADRVPESRIGRVAAVSGVIQYVGTLVGALIAGLLFAAIGLASYFPVAVVLGLATVSFVVFARDRSSKGMETAPLRTGSFFESFITALRDRDFRWAWIAKMVLQAGFQLGSVYAIYMLQSYVQPSMSATEAAKTAPLLAAAGFPLGLLAMVVVGRWSDKIQRRKPFVFAASVIMAVSFLVPFVWPSLPAMYIQAVLAGLGYATFSVVDQALFIDILPDRAAAGRDLGVAALAGGVGQAVGPIIAGAVVTVSGGEYGPVFPVAFLFVFLAAFAVLPIRRVR